MTEKERNKRLMLLITKLYHENDIESIELIKTLIDNDTASMKLSFKIMTENTELSSLLGVENLSELNFKKDEK